MTVATARVISTAHWVGDPRLNRHVRYLERHGIETRLISLDDGSGRRLLAIWRALLSIWRDSADVVILPDPELFALGSLVARVRRVPVVLDIHEDYSMTALTREWVPRLLRRPIRMVARLNDMVGRWLASRVMVASEDLKSNSSIVVPNIPDPAEFTPSPPDQEQPFVVYVGDVTVARGALEMAQLGRLLPDVEVLVIGRVSEGLAQEMRAVAGDRSRLVLTGRLPHPEAWQRAAGALAGLSPLRGAPAYLNATATKLWEYCALGLPPIVTDLPGQRSVVSEIDPSLICDNAEGMAELVGRLLAEESWQAELASRARAKAIEMWSRWRPDQAIFKAVSLDRSQ